MSEFTRALINHQQKNKLIVNETNYKINKSLIHSFTKSLIINEAVGLLR